VRISYLASRAIINLLRLRNRNIAAEAFRKAVNDLKNELQIADSTVAWLDGQANIENILGTVDGAKEKYDERSKDHSGTRAWLEKFSSRVMIYGKVFDALAQHHPEYVALAWGAVKFVLMVYQPNSLLMILRTNLFIARVSSTAPRSSKSLPKLSSPSATSSLERT
jgi:hypothetical protein